jgi:hypothetical protein
VFLVICTDRPSVTYRGFLLTLGKDMIAPVVGFLELVGGFLDQLLLGWQLRVTGRSWNPGDSGPMLPASAEQFCHLLACTRGP